MTSAGTGRQRVVCFIDGSNLYSLLESAFGSGKVKLNRLCGELAGEDRELVQWRYYAATLPQGATVQEKSRYWRQQRFFQAAIKQHRKAQLRLGRFQRDKTGALREKGVDVLLAVDLIELARENKYDAAVVMSADGDLVPVIQVVQRHFQKRVEVALPRSAPAFHIREVSDRYIEITRELYETVRIA